MTPIGMEDVETEEVVEMSDEGETPMTEEGTPESTSVHIPTAALGRSVEPGETITLRVVASDENGVQAEVVESVRAEGDYEEADVAFDRMATEPPADY